MNVTSFSFFAPPTLSLASAPRLAQLSGATVDAPVVMDPGLSQVLMTPIQVLNGRWSSYPSQAAEAVLWNSAVSDDFENGALQSAALMVSAETDTELSTFDTIVYGAVAFWAFLALVSVIGSIAITMGQRWVKQREQTREAERAMSAMSAEKRLNNLLAKISAEKPDGIPVREPIVIEDEREALQAGLNVLKLWQESLATRPADEAWEMVLTKEQALDYLPPTYSLMITPGSINIPRPNEEIIASTATGKALPDIDSLLRKHHGA